MKKKCKAKINKVKITQNNSINKLIEFLVKDKCIDCGDIIYLPKNTNIGMNICTRCYFIREAGGRYGH